MLLLINLFYLIIITPILNGDTSIKSEDGKPKHIRWIIKFIFAIIGIHFILKYITLENSSLTYWTIFVLLLYFCWNKRSLGEHKRLF